LGAPPLGLGSIDTAETDVARVLAPLYSYAPFTPLQNASSQPAINLPLHWNAAGLPIGTQFLGRFGDEATLLGLAAEKERGLGTAVGRTYRFQSHRPTASHRLRSPVAARS
jgi:amidase